MLCCAVNENAPAHAQHEGSNAHAPAEGGACGRACMHACSLAMLRRRSPWRSACCRDALPATKRLVLHDTDARLCKLASQTRTLREREQARGGGTRTASTRPTASSTGGQDVCFFSPRYRTKPTPALGVMSRAPPSMKLSCNCKRRLFGRAGRRAHGHKTGHKSPRSRRRTVVAAAAARVRVLCVLRRAGNLLGLRLHDQLLTMVSKSSCPAPYLWAPTSF